MGLRTLLLLVLLSDVMIVESSVSARFQRLAKSVRNLLGFKKEISPPSSPKQSTDLDFETYIAKSKEKEDQWSYLYLDEEEKTQLVLKWMKARLQKYVDEYNIFMLIRPIELASLERLKQMFYFNGLPPPEEPEVKCPEQPHVQCKSLDVHQKSSNWGLTSGFIPVDPFFNKDNVGLPVFNPLMLSVGDPRLSEKKLRALLAKKKPSIKDEIQAMTIDQLHGELAKIGEIQPVIEEKDLFKCDDTIVYQEGHICVGQYIQLKRKMDEILTKKATVTLFPADSGVEHFGTGWGVIQLRVALEEGFIKPLPKSMEYCRPIDCDKSGSGKYICARESDAVAAENRKISSASAKSTYGYDDIVVRNRTRALPKLAPIKEEGSKKGGGAADEEEGIQKTYSLGTKYTIRFCVDKDDGKVFWTDGDGMTPIYVFAYGCTDPEPPNVISPAGIPVIGDYDVWLTAYALDSDLISQPSSNTESEAKANVTPIKKPYPFTKIFIGEEFLVRGGAAKASVAQQQMFDRSDRRNINLALTQSSRGACQVIPHPEEMFNTEFMQPISMSKFIVFVPQKLLKLDIESGVLELQGSTRSKMLALSQVLTSLHTHHYVFPLNENYGVDGKKLFEKLLNDQALPSGSASPTAFSRTHRETAETLFSGMVTRNTFKMLTTPSADPAHIDWFDFLSQLYKYISALGNGKATSARGIALETLWQTVFQKLRATPTTVTAQNAAQKPLFE